MRFKVHEEKYYISKLLQFVGTAEAAHLLQQS